ncbi:MAG TPA: FUSC family protein, partial [Conexibacter sp.]|nr:FUSC family protein [Conexibacter sp.]
LIETRRGGATADAARAAVERERAALADAFARAAGTAAAAHDEEALAQLLDETFQLRLLGHAAWQLAGHALRACDLAAPARDVPPGEDPLAPPPAVVAPPRGGARATVAAAERVAVAHASMGSVWLRNSVRGAIALAAAVLVGQLADVQHAFWIVLGTLTVLRSHALDTGATVVRALAGTLAGIVAGGLLVLALGSHEAALWAVLPPAALLAAYAPRAVSFAAGQAAFSLLVLVLFNLLAPAGWQVGLLRIEDVAIGGAVSLAVGVLLWPRGAGAVLRAQLGEAYVRSVEDVVATVGALLGERSEAEREQATAHALAAGERLDDVFRQYLAERTCARSNLPQLALLVAGGTRVRRTAAMLRSGTARRLAQAGGRPDAARRAALDAQLDALRTWHLALAASLERASEPPVAQPPDAARRARMLGWLRDALAGDPEQLPPALSLAWTDRHLDALRELERELSAAALATLPR